MMYCKHNGRQFRITGLNFSGRLAIAEYYSDILNEWLECKHVSTCMQLARIYKEKREG